MTDQPSVVAETPAIEASPSGKVDSGTAVSPPSSSQPQGKANIAKVIPAGSAAPATQAPQQQQTPAPQSIKKPEWATGDPFFDTMAGMDSPEYRQYYSGKGPAALESQHGGYQILGVATASMTIADQTDGTEGSPAASAGSPAAVEVAVAEGEETAAEAIVSESSSSFLPYPNTGLDHWNRTREQWTKGRWHVVPSANSNNPALSAIHPGNHDAIYDSLVYDRKRLSKPIPLPLVVKVLVSGWKRDGLWQESPSQPQSAPGSTPSSAPSSAPTASPHGFNAYTPGFSSTHSQSLLKKL